jgi:hypothetical protein
VTVYCERDDCEWGQPCKTTRKPLPARQKPLSSWHAQRAVKSEKLSDIARAALTDASAHSIRPENRKRRVGAYEGRFSAKGPPIEDAA